MRQNVYKIEKDTVVPFRNHADYCVGTGRMGLALHKEYQEQLKLVQDEIGFQYIRGHGLFCDDMAVYQEYEDENGVVHAEYNFIYLDRVMDSYRALKLRPFLELGFMPEKLASGSQTVFYWKGNVTPPKEYEAWTALVQATLRHLIERYGLNEVLCWPIEVWNEPNLKIFWKDADMEEYFRLFRHTFLAIKEVDTRFRVGGPAVCGGTDVLWVRSFLEFCEKNSLAVDFISRHHYTTTPPKHEGHYSYVELHDPKESFRALEATREIADSFEAFRGIEIHVTEFNTSYTPKAPVHDTNLNAAYVALLLSRMGDKHASYSYWTFGDVFEELGVPFTPFHGGFGLAANGCIPKPTFWTFAFFKKLTGECVHRSDDAVVVRKENGGYCGIAWNLAAAGQRSLLELTFSLPLREGADYCLLTRTVDEGCCNPLKLWHDLGEPSGLTDGQLALLREGARPALATERLSAEAGGTTVTLSLSENAVVYFELKEAPIKSDRGYSYERVLKTAVERK